MRMIPKKSTVFDLDFKGFADLRNDERKRAWTHKKRMAQGIHRREDGNGGFGDLSGAVWLIKWVVALMAFYTIGAGMFILLYWEWL